MSYIKFEKDQLINLEFSLRQEYLKTNKAGSFGSSTIINCNTRKYHGLLICPIDAFNGDNHILLASLDDTIIQHDAEFHLAVRKYPGNIYHPGHKYIRECTHEAGHSLVYRVGGVVLRREMILVEKEMQVLIKYTLEDCHSPTKLRLHPFLAFRSIHELTFANMDANTKYIDIPNGIKMRMYEPYPYLHMQLSKEAEYISCPDWFYNMVYDREKDRGYPYQEDQFVPGFFEVELKKGESVVFSASTKEVTPNGLKQKFASEIKKHSVKDNYLNCLQHAAKQFIVEYNNETVLYSGYPWFGKWTRDTFISLPGLTLSQGDVKTCKKVLDSMAKKQVGALFPTKSHTNSQKHDSVDTSLWFIWAIQKYAAHVSPASVWKSFGENIKAIIDGYTEGTEFNIHMLDNKLIYAGEENHALTWMDAIIDGKPVTPRIGCPVEINALWYNAVCFALEIAKAAKDNQFVAKHEALPEQIASSFNENFWCNSNKYLSDYVNGEYKDCSVRPNQVIATSLPYSPLNDVKKNSVLECVKSELLTPKGLRSLSPKNPAYKGTCFGDAVSRDSAYHQGTVWPWLLGHYVEGMLKVHGKSVVSAMEAIYNEFDAEMKNHGIGTISEIYDGNPPYEARGAISQAWSIAEILRIRTLIDETKQEQPQFS